MSGLIIALIIAIVIIIIIIIGAIYATSGDSTPGSQVQPVLPSDGSPTPSTNTDVPLVDDAAKIAAEKAAAERAAADQLAATNASIDAALAEAYGLNPARVCPSGKCAYGIVGMMGGQCRAMSGAMNGTPGDTTWTDCHVTFSQKPQRGFLPAGSCPSGACQYGIVNMTGKACRAIGGRMNGTPGDDEWTSCHMNIGTQPKFGLFPQGKCPTGTCYPVRFGAIGTECRAIGGSATGDSWTPCEMSFGPLARS